MRRARCRHLQTLLSFAAMLVLAAAQAAPPSVTLREVGAGFSSPVEAVHANDGSTRFYVVEQGGRIRILQDGVVLSPPFLDISTGGIIAASGERGLLGLAFHPNHAVNRAFYIYYTRANGDLVVARVLRSASNPNLADPASRVEVLVVPHPGQSNHNGGKIEFGADGLLYVATGDGGGGGDPFRAGQNLNDGRGKILRLAVDGGTGYAIPASNPFAASSCLGTEFCKEVFHYGLRNPWRFSFDRATSDLLIGDVGQGAIEEIDFAPAGAAGLNFGWGIFEGNTCYNDTYFGAAGACAGLANHTRPVLTYGHNATGGISVTGGFRYRGRKSAALRGYYLYADYVSQRIWAARSDAAGAWTTEVLLPPPAVLDGISSFAQDERGEVYVVDYGNGKLWAIDGPAPAARVATDFDADARSDLLYRNEATGEVFRAFMRGFSLARGAIAYREPDTAWRVVADGDFDGDGVADLLWRNAGTGHVYVQLFDTQGLPATGAVVHVEPDEAWRVVAAPDLDGDGRSDVLWWNEETGLVYGMLMNGASIAQQGVVHSAPDTAWRIAASGDFAGSGKRNQLLWRHASSGDVYLMTVNVAVGGFATTGSTIYREADPSWRIAGAADFDGDGKSDILWRHEVDGRVHLMLMDGGAIRQQAQVYAEPDAAWKIAAHGDYDGDGLADILWRNDTTGDVYLMLMNGIAIRAQGTVYREPNPGWRLLGPREYAP